MLQIDKNISMCLTTGRSGTNLLEELLSLADDTCALHEPAPYFSDHIVKVRDSEKHALYFVKNEKLPAILNIPEKNYAETSHLFGKGFFEAFIELNIPFNLMILSRPPREVAKSLWRIGAIPARTEKGVNSLYHPDEGNVLKVKDWQSLSNYQLCFWYCLEVERRKDLYRQTCKDKGLPVAEISLEDLRDWNKFVGFAEKLGLNIPASAEDKFKAITATKVNKKRKYFSKIPLKPLSMQEKDLWKKIDDPKLKSIVEARYAN